MGFVMNKISPEISEVAGLFAADGSMQKNHICFWGNPKADKSFYDVYLTRLFYKAFNIEINPYYKPSNSVYGFYICNKEIINYFQNVLSFFPGSKTYIVKIPYLIMNSKNKKIKSSFIRGFFAGDGSLSFMKRYGVNNSLFKKTHHYYPRIQIQSASKSIISQMSYILDELKINNFNNNRTNKIKNNSDPSVLNVYGLKQLEKWVKTIGFSNKNHGSRYKVFKKFGFVPPLTTFSESIKIINNQLNPYLFYRKKGL